MDDKKTPKNDDGLEKLRQALENLNTNLDALEEQLLKIKQALEKLNGIKRPPN